MPERRAVAGSTAVQAEPNVAPMIDVLLVLLVIFMLLVPLQRRHVTAQLPAREPRGEGAAGMVLEVGPAGRLALNREPVTEAALGERLRAVYAGRPDKTLIIRGDRAATYQAVITAMNRARGAGVRVIGLDPRP
jgi:biopolymer transport protein TolR